MAWHILENSSLVKIILMYFDKHKILKHAISPRKVPKYIVKPKGMWKMKSCSI